MIPKSFDQIRAADILQLIADKVKELRTLEYKQRLPFGTEPEKLEFLKDVSSFANAAGGDLLYGVTPELDGGKPTGAPEEARGLKGFNSDAEILRLDSFLRSHLRPRLLGVRMQPIPGFPDGDVLLIRVPRSFQAPHMVTFQDDGRFYTRNNAGKHRMDVGEVRTAFGLSENLADRVRQFRAGRLSLIVAGETPLPLLDGGKVVLHVLPVSALDPNSEGIDLQQLHRRIDGMPLLLPRRQTSHRRFNLDGLLYYHYLKFGEGGPGNYTQAFRSGAVEAVDSWMLQAGRPSKVLPAIDIESSLSECLGGCLRTLRELGVSPPVFVLPSLLGVRGLTINRDGEASPGVDRDDLLLPDLLVEDFHTDAATLLRPAFDAMWQAAGWMRSFNYDAEDNFRPRY
jgi:Schlafen, AlbA_2